MFIIIGVTISDWCHKLGWGWQATVVTVLLAAGKIPTLSHGPVIPQSHFCIELYYPKSRYPRQR